MSWGIPFFAAGCGRDMRKRRLFISVLQEKKSVNNGSLTLMRVLGERSHTTRIGLRQEKKNKEKREREFKPSLNGLTVNLDVRC